MASSCRLPGGERVDRLEYDVIRPTLDALKPLWDSLIAGRQGFFLEDKGWALALHARFADENETERVLAEARRNATEAIDRASPGLFRLLGGHKFLEIGPTAGAQRPDGGRFVGPIPLAWGVAPLPWGR